MACWMKIPGNCCTGFFSLQQPSRLLTSAAVVHQYKTNSKPENPLNCSLGTGEWHLQVTRIPQKPEKKVI